MGWDDGRFVLHTNAHPYRYTTSNVRVHVQVCIQDGFFIDIKDNSVNGQGFIDLECSPVLAGWEL